jgi:predicted ABC-class ATPase
LPATISQILRRIDGHSYREYRKLLGKTETIGNITIETIHIQGDPFAPPSVVKAIAPLKSLPQWATAEPIPLSDYLHRILYTKLKEQSTKLGEGHSGTLKIPKPSPVMIQRSSLEVTSNKIIVRAWVGLPSRKRRILGEAAKELLLYRLPRAIDHTISRARRTTTQLRRHIDTWRIQEDLRRTLQHKGLVAFIGDGSILPRRCGWCDDPLPHAKPFESPPSLRVELETSHGNFTGMGIGRGVTVITGPAFHGKTTLLEAIQHGIYNHIPGDGRELVVSLKATFKIRAEDGRHTSCVDISPFIRRLPARRDTECFTTDDASGATSMAAAIQEAIELNAKLLLIDEDTSATNLLFRDERLKHIVGEDTVVTIADQAHDISKYTSLIVVSSTSAHLVSAADTTIVMKDYIPHDVTADIGNIAPTYNVQQRRGNYKPPRPRCVVDVPNYVKLRLEGRVIRSKGSRYVIDTRFNEQLVEDGQVQLLAMLLSRLNQFKSWYIKDLARWFDEVFKLHGFEGVLGSEPGPGLAEVRGYDLAMLINRLPQARIGFNCSYLDIA